MVKFYLNSPKSEYSAVRLSSQINKIRFRYVIPDLRIPTRLWDKKTQRIKFSPEWPEAEILNRLLDAMSRTIQNMIYESRIKIEVLTHNEVLKALEEFNIKINEDQTPTFQRFYEKWLNNRERSGKYAPGTIKRDRVVYHKIVEYNLAHSRSPLDWHTLSVSSLRRFEAHYINQEFSTNYVSKMISIIKTALSDPDARPYLKDRDFLQDIKLKHTPVDSIYVNIEELSKLYDLDLQLHPGMDKVRDHFLIAAFTGTRYGDIHKIGDNIEIAENGSKLINIRATKTKELVCIPLHSIVERIIEKYKGKIPKPISNQKMNQHLKNIGAAAGLNGTVVKHHFSGSTTKTNKYEKWELLTTHTARRSFATNAYLAHVPILSIMKITGHTTQRSFMKYIRMSTRESAMHIANHAFFQSGVRK